jgi:hypothetical protein
MKSWPRLFVSLLLAITVTTLFSLRSFAAPEAVDMDATGLISGPLLEGPTGTLTIRDGEVTINGNAVQTGATVMTGSRITTDSDGVAVIDLGGLGRIEIRDDTTIILNILPGGVHIRSECGRTYVKVTRGQVEVRSPKSEVIPAGEDEAYGESIEAVTNASADFVVDCGGHKPWALLFAPLGLLALLGLSASKATGIAVGDTDTDTPPPVSPFAP